MKHIAWDFDGTIVDSFSLWKKVMIDYCQSNHLPLPDDEEVKPSFGDTNWRGFSVWNMPLEIQDKHRFEAYDVFYDIQKKQPTALPPVDGVIGAIQQLTENGYIQSIVTSRPRQMLIDMLEHLKIKEYFQFLNAGECAEENHLQDKPFPDKLIFVMSQLSIKSENTLMIGDTYMDIGMAKNAHVQSLAVTWGMGSEKSLKESGADFILSDAFLLKASICEIFLKKDDFDRKEKYLPTNLSIIIDSSTRTPQNQRKGKE